MEGIAKLLKERYPKVEFSVESHHEMTIYPKVADGFKIVLRQGAKENTIYFGNWHSHFPNDEDGTNELLDYLDFGMSGRGRLKVYLRDGKEYKWTFETRDEEDKQWLPARTMGLMNVQVWQKPIIKYYQNNLTEPVEFNEHS